MCRSVTTPAEFRRRFTYDDRGRLVSVVDEAGWTIDYEHDQAGNRTRRRAGPQPTGGTGQQSG